MTKPGKGIAFATFAALLLGTSSLVGCIRTDTTGNGYVASVNGDEVTLREFMTALAAEAGSETLQKLVETRLIFQEAKRQGVELPESAIATEVERIRFNIKDKEGVRVFVDQAKAKALLRLLILKNVSDQELKETFELFHADLEQFEVLRIVLPDEDTAKQVYVALETGSKFEDLAATSSLDESTKKSGGSPGYLTRQGLLACYGDAVTKIVLGLRPGETSKPMRLADERYLILKRANEKTSFEELRASVENIYINRDRKEFIYRLTSKSEILSPFLAKDEAQIGLPAKEKAPPLPGWSPKPKSTPTPEATPDYELPSEAARPKYEGPLPVRETTVIAPPSGATHSSP